MNTKRNYINIVVSLLFIFVSIFSIRFILNNIGDVKQSAAVFSTNGTTGNWNHPHTWGLTAGLTAFSNVQYLTVATSGKIYISDYLNNRVVVLNPDGTTDTVYSGNYLGNPINTPTGIDISSTTGEIFFAQRGGVRRILVLNPDGTASTSYNPFPSGSLGGIEIAPSGYIYVIDSNNDSVDILNPDGTASTTYNKSGTLRVLSDFHDIAVDSIGRIYITSRIFGQGAKGYVTVLNPDGTEYATYGGDTTYNGLTINEIGGIDISTITGKIYLVDMGNARIIVLNPDGTESAIFTPVGISQPRGIALDSNDNIYVGNNTLLIVNPDGTASTTYNGLKLPNSFVPVEGTDYPGPNDNVTISNGTVTLSADQNVNNITLSGGTLNLNGFTLNVYGDWTRLGGTLITGTGTINFVSTNTQRISGSNTFYNLTKVSSVPSALLFDYSTTTTITNNLTLTGTSGNLLTIGRAFIAPSWAQTVTQSFAAPQGIAHNSSGDIYVSDIGNNTIKRFDNNGSFITSFSSIAAPAEIKVGSDENLYVNDLSGYILKFNSSNTLVASTSVVSPRGISVDSSGNLYVNTNGSVVKMDSGFNILISTSTVNGTAFNFSCHYGGNEIDPTETFLYVADNCNNRVVKLNLADLSFVSSFAGAPSENFNGPMSITFDSNGNIYVTNNGNSRIMIFDPDFNYLTYFGGIGGLNNQFWNARQVTIDNNDNIFVVDIGQANYKRFTLIPFAPFNILKTGSGSANLSYLSVSHSTNLSSSEFSCTNCIDDGDNTNWVFLESVRRSRPVKPLTEEPIPTVVYVNTTSTPTTTPDTTVSTSTDSNNSVVKVEDKKEKEPSFGANSMPYYFFTRTLSLGSFGDDVKKLQIFLNAHGYTVSEDGPGSRGNETNFFGIKTRAALIRFQEDNTEDILVPQNLPQGTGIFWVYSRKIINALLAKQIQD